MMLVESSLEGVQQRVLQLIIPLILFSIAIFQFGVLCQFEPLVYRRFYVFR